MDLGSDAGELPTRTNVGRPELEQAASLTGAPCRTESRGTISLRLLEFKTHLLEAVEELHIRRDAETRFEAQTNKLVLEKQELEWQKETLQHEIETMANQHTESLANIKKQFQVKIRNIEEEKGKQQVSAELKDKEINSLKEELKSLQLLKYNLEKKSSELEQKLTLQTRSKESHLNQLGEVEKRFGALSRQCAWVKQAHEKLEQNVDEAIKINKKLTSANDKQEMTIAYLKQELGGVNNQLIKAKMLSVRRDETGVPSGREQQAQQLHHKLMVETEMNKKLVDENVAERAAKQVKKLENEIKPRAAAIHELMRSLQHSQQLLLSQTQAVCRAELELQTQSEEHQALKQEHEMVREKSKALEDKMVQLMESYTASKTTWDKEKAEFLDRIQSEQQNLQTVKEAYEQLRQKHAELSLQAKLQARHTYEVENKMKDATKQRLSKGVQTGEFCTNNGCELDISPEELCVSHTMDQTTESDRNLESFDLTGRSCDVGLPVDSSCVDPSETSISQLKDCSQILGVSTTLVTFVVETTGERAVNGPNVGSLQHVDSSQPRNPDCLTITEAETKQDDTETMEGQETQIHHQQSQFKESSSSVSAPLSPSNKRIIETSRSTNSMPSDLVLSNGGVQMSKDSSVHGTTTSRPEYGPADPPGDPLKKKGKADEVNKGAVEREQEAMEVVRGEKTTGEETETNEEQGRRNVKEVKTADKVDRREESGGSAEDQDDTRKPERETNDGTTAVRTPEPETEAQTSPPDNNRRDGEKNDTPAVDSMDGTAPQPTEDSQSTSEDTGEGDRVGKACGTEREERDCVDRQSEKAARFDTRLPEALRPSRAISSEANVAPSAPRSVGVLESEAMKTQTEPCQTTDVSETCDGRESEECAPSRTDDPLLRSQETSDPEVGQPKPLLTDPDAREKNGGRVVAQQPVKECRREEAADQRGSRVDVGVESQAGNDGCRERVKNNEEVTEGKGESPSKPFVQISPNKDASPETGSSKDQEQLPPIETLLRDAADSSLPRNKNSTLSFDWAAAQTKTESKRVNSDTSELQGFVQRPPTREPNASGSSGFVGQTSSTLPVFLKTKQNKVPLVIAGAPDLSNGSGLPASSRRHRQGEKNAIRGTADTDGRSSPWMSSFPASTSSGTVGKRSLQTAPGSQERDEQQSSLRAQISKIEQFLSAERLRLPKRRRTDT